MYIKKINLSFWHKGTRKVYEFESFSKIQEPLFSLETVEKFNHIKIDLVPKETLLLESFVLTMKRKVRPSEKVFVNGYQTWTDSREFEADEQLFPLNPLMKPVTNRFRMKYYGDYHFYEYPQEQGTFHSYTYTYFRTDETVELWGSLMDKTGFTIFETNVYTGSFQIAKDCKKLEISEKYEAFELFQKTGDTTKVWEDYFEAMGEERSNAKAVSGWTSWYHHYTKISEEIVLKNLAAFAYEEMPIDLFQIDDGYQKSVGDWTENSKFPNGMKILTDRIHQKGYKAGLWIAPFICEEKSSIRINHPEWICRDEQGKPLSIGYSLDWSGNFYALDFENEDVKNHLRRTFIRILEDWNFDMLKLDFLHAVAIVPPRHKTRGQVMREAMEFLRELAGDKLLLGCGVPLSSAFGLVDYCRIGADVALKWEDALLEKRLRYRERVSTKCSLNSTIGRHQLNGRFFLNDPDVFILRNENNSLSFTEKHSLFVLNQVMGGLLFTSDDIATYDGKTLRLYSSQFPLLEKKNIVVNKEGEIYQITFEIEDKKYFLCANLSDKPYDLPLPEGQKYFAPKKIVSHSLHLFPHQTQIFKVVEGKEVELLGSTGHLFTGADVKKLSIEGQTIDIQRYDKSLKAATIYLSVPIVGDYMVNGQLLAATEQLGRVILEVDFGESEEEA